MTMTQTDMPSGPDRRLLPTSDVLKFNSGDEFYRQLRLRIDQYFASCGRDRRDCPQMYLKTVIIVVWFVASYGLLVFVAGSWWSVVPLAISLGLAMAAIGFNIQHDGGHQAYSKRPWANRLMARSLDLMGASSYFWARKHNTIHHSYANITGHDDDINLGFLGRLSPHQKRLWFHRYQHLYLWVLYGFLAIKWQAYDDFRDLAVGRVGGKRFTRPKRWDLAVFLGGKAIFFSLMLVIPLLMHPLWTVLLVGLTVSFVEGFALSIVFQLAHCVEEAAFPLPCNDTDRMETAWAEHQVEATVDFAPRNRLLSWFIGGLNFQIEHHLFPRICHVHYPAIAPLVEQTCREQGLPYVVNETFLSAAISHYRWLRRMGMPRTAPE